MREKPKKCPLCITKLKVRGNELYCPECGYKYCDHSYNGNDIYDTADHYHETHATYTPDPALDSTQDPSLYSTQDYAQAPFQRSIPTNGQIPTKRTSPVLTSGPGKKTTFSGVIITTLFILGILALFCFQVMTETDFPELIDEWINYSRGNTTENAKGNTKANTKGHGTDAASAQAVEKLFSHIEETHGLQKEQIIEKMQYIYVYSDSSGNLVWYYYLDGGISDSYQSKDTNFRITDLAQFTNLYALYVPEVILQKKELDSFTKLSCLECSNTPDELTKIIDPKKINYLILHDSRDNLHALNNLDQFTNLYYLSIQSTAITDLSSLSSCSGLIELDLYTPKYVGSYDFLQDIPGLMGLTLQTDWLVSMDFCKNCPKLQSLHIYQYKDASALLLSGIDNLQDLEELYIQGIGVKDISLSELANLPNLTNLSLPFCNLSDISLLEECENLNTLDLQGNHLKEFSDLPALPNLYQVNLSYNYLKEMPDDTSSWPLLNAIDVSGNNLRAESIQSFTTAHPEIVVYYVDEKN